MICIRILFIIEFCCFSVPRWTRMPGGQLASAVCSDLVYRCLLHESFDVNCLICINFIHTLQDLILLFDQLASQLKEISLFSVTVSVIVTPLSVYMYMYKCY